MHSVIYDHQTFSLQEYGGISRYFCELAARVHRSPGFRARIVAPAHFNHYLKASRVPQSAMYIRMRIPRTGLFYRTANALLSPPLMWAGSPSLIHQTYYAPATRVAGAPVVVTVFDMIHELFPTHFRAGDSTSRDKERSVKLADHVLCISESTKSDLIRLFDVPEKKVSVTYLGIASTFTLADPHAGSVGAGTERPYLLFVGHRQGYKGFTTSLRAYAASAALRAAFDFVTFGGFEFNTEELSLMRSLGVREGSVRRIEGDDALLASAYRRARALVYPSLYEGFGIPPLEAMSCGCPVVCSNTSSIPEVVGTAAESFDPKDVDSIRQAVERVCFDDARRSQLIEMGLQRTALFSWDRCAAATVAAYNHLLQ